ncbi:MAG: SAM hydrolase/SAM-dependent halogenase family protein [Leptospirillia bacterium]
MKRFVTFTSDFGTRDSYVASVKLRILSGAPHCEVIDVTHEIPPFSPALALPSLVDIMRVSPSGTIHLCVVDPGVGSSRRALAGEGQNAFFILPDNGLPSLLNEWVGGLAFYHMNSPEIFGGEATATFQGRDLFAPAVVALAAGKMSPRDMGSRVDAESLTSWGHFLEPSDSHLLAWNIDHFGNILLDYYALVPPEKVDMSLAGTAIPYVRRYQEVPKGSLGCLINSSGWLEIFCREGSASKKTGMEIGQRIAARIEGGSGRRLLSTNKKTAL